MTVLKAKKNLLTTVDMNGIFKKSLNLFVRQLNTNNKNNNNKILSSVIQKNWAQELPSQPVPSLSLTILNLLSFNQVFLKKLNRTSKELEQIEETYKVCRELSTSKSVVYLQELLNERAQSLSNWLTPWWLNIAYLEGRTPLPIVTSPGVIFPPFKLYSTNKDRIDLAARIIHANYNFMRMIYKQELPQERLKNGDPLDMSQYLYLYGTTRIPQRKRDLIYHINYQSQSDQHIIVTHNGHTFFMPIVIEGKLISLNNIKEMLNEIILASETKNAYPINICSADNRDLWADVYKRVKANNKESLNIFENALFVLGLDNSFNKKNQSCIVEQMRQAIHGGGTKENSANRWFDKCIQFIINDDCDVGLTYEHTPADGPPVASLLDYVYSYVESGKYIKENIAESNGTKVPKKLEFNLTDEDRQAIQLSSKNFDCAVNNLEISVLKFEHFGKDVSKLNKISPDGLIQIALQLTYYRLHKFHTPTYETATLRRFRNGRTETIRLPNDQSITFVESVINKLNVNVQKKYLIAAVKSHSNYTVQAMNGQGMDRHLLGLKLMALEKGIELPLIFSSNIYKELMHFRLSTSQVPTNGSLLMVFGPSASDCYGICYNPKENNISFTITAFNNCIETSSVKFAAELENSLLILRNILREEKVDYIKPKL